MRCMICDRYFKAKRDILVCPACDSAIIHIADCESDVQVELALLINPTGKILPRIEDDDYNDTESFSS